MDLNISIKNVDLVTASQVIENITPLLNNRERLCRDFTCYGSNNGSQIYFMRTNYKPID